MKRSAQVVLVMMAATGVGAGSYALMPREDCSQTQLGQAQPESCRSSRSGSGHGSSYFSGRSSNVSSSAYTSPSAASSLTSHSGSSPAAPAGGTVRGGFGGLASHFSGGG